MNKPTVKLDTTTRTYMVQGVPDTVRGGIAIGVLALARAAYIVKIPSYYAEALIKLYSIEARALEAQVGAVSKGGEVAA